VREIALDRARAHVVQECTRSDTPTAAWCEITAVAEPFEIVVRQTRTHVVEQ